MESKALPSFWDGFDRLPQEIQKRAKKQYLLWQEDPSHRSVRFKKVGKFWSARVTGAYRAVGIMDGDTIVWFFIGTHSEYERLLA